MLLSPPYPCQFVIIYEVMTYTLFNFSTDEQLVLRYRYIHNCTWEQIGNELNADARTIRRWHKDALQKVKIPPDAIEI